VTGIGPKIALSILSTISPEEFFQAVQSEDVALLCRDLDGTQFSSTCPHGRPTMIQFHLVNLKESSREWDKNINKLIKDIELPREWQKDLKQYCDFLSYSNKKSHLPHIGPYSYKISVKSSYKPLNTIKRI
jgi:hypothetical protein